MTPDECRQLLSSLGCMVMLPTYNNAGTLMQVIADVRQYCNDIMVVNDGSTDDTHRLLQACEGITVLEYPDGKNRGKGHALKCGLRKAAAMGFRYAITLDSDGQHFANDIPAFAQAIQENPDALIIGARNLKADNMPEKNTFANKFSNFWFLVETGRKLSDTQSGYRLYPLSAISKMRFFTPRYEFEVEVIVRCAWRGVKVMNIPIKVIYPPDRVSHFRPLHDFTRISILNTALVLGALLYYYPKCLIKWLRPSNVADFFSRNLLHSGESSARLAAAAALGVFMGIVPLWGFQTVTAIYLAHILRLNKIIVVAFANISLPPMLPFILYASLWTGAELCGTPLTIDIDTLTAQKAAESLWQYILGSVVFGAAFAAAVGLTLWGILKIFRR